MSKTHTKSRKRQVLTVLLAGMFLLGILGNVRVTENIALPSVTAAVCGSSSKAEQKDPAQQTQVPGHMASISSAETISRMADFHISGSLRKGDTGAEQETAETVSVVLLLLFAPIWGRPGRYRRRFIREERPEIRIVSFIHRMDGKKRPLFCSIECDKTGGYQNGCRNKI